MQVLEDRIGSLRSHNRDAKDNINLKKSFYIQLLTILLILDRFPLFLSVKTITKLNLGEGKTFEIKMKNIIVLHFLHTV